VFIYKNIQYKIPIRYLNNGGNLIDFGKGIEGSISIIPSINQNSNGAISADWTGAIIYLSQKVKDSLLGQIYMLSNNQGNYSGFSIVNKQEDPVVNYLSATSGKNFGDFVYYQGLRGPLDVWKINYPENTPIYKQFLNESLEYGGQDYLFK
jgi:hypothetical protein